MTKFFAFLWKWPLPILGLLFLILPLLGNALASILVWQTVSLSGTPNEGDGRQRIISEALSPDGLTKAQVIESFRTSKDVVKLLMSDSMPWQHGLVYITRPDEQIDPEWTFYVLGYDHEDQLEKSSRGQIAVEWLSNDLLQVNYCNVQISEFDNFATVYDENDFEIADVEVTLRRSAECYSEKDET